MPVHRTSFIERTTKRFEFFVLAFRIHTHVFWIASIDDAAAAIAARTRIMHACVSRDRNYALPVAVYYRAHIESACMGYSLSALGSRMLELKWNDDARCLCVRNRHIESISKQGERRVARQTRAFEAMYAGAHMKLTRKQNNVIYAAFSQQNIVWYSHFLAGWAIIARHDHTTALALAIMSKRQQHQREMAFAFKLVGRPNHYFVLLVALVDVITKGSNGTRSEPLRVWVLSLYLYGAYATVVRTRYRAHVSVCTLPSLVCVSMDLQQHGKAHRGAWVRYTFVVVAAAVASAAAEQ